MHEVYLFRVFGFCKIALPTTESQTRQLDNQFSYRECKSRRVLAWCLRIMRLYSSINHSDYEFNKISLDIELGQIL